MREWLLAVVGTAAVSSLILSVTPEGAAKKVLRVTASAAVIAAMLSVVSGQSGEELLFALSRYGAEAAQVTEGAKSDAASLTRAVIEERCSEYILTKADELSCGIVSASVTAEWDEGGFWRPVRAELDYRGEESAELKLAIEAELGIPREKQEWRRQDE